MKRDGGQDERLSELIGELYDAAADQRLWAGIAPRIAAACDSTSAVLKTCDASGHVRLLDSTQNLVVAERDASWADHWHRNDLWVERSVAYGMSRVITSRDLVAAAEEDRSAFYQEWLRHLDIHHMVGAVFPAGNDGIGVLGIHRPRRAGRYAAADRGRVALLLPHLRRAVHLGQRLGRASLVQSAALDTLDRIDSGIMVVDGTRRVVHANALAEMLLRRNDEICVLGGRLVIRQAVLNARLAALVRDNIETAAGRPTPPRTALAVPRDDRLPLTLAVVPLRPGWSRRDGQAPLALVFLRDPEHATVMQAQLRDLFGLTASEAAVAAELARGASLAGIAASTGVGLATVRSHLKRILGKTGTSRQAEVVALIGRTVAAVFDRS